MQRSWTTRRRPAGARFLDPRVLARIGNLELLARVVVEGFLSGLHRSRSRGVSLDFAEHRPYSPGDDTRRIDWRLYARTDRYHIKEFEADTNVSFLALLDVSPSMRYASGRVDGDGRRAGVGGRRRRARGAGGRLRRGVQEAGAVAEPGAARTAPVTKLDYARFLVACLAHLAHRQGDRIGLATFDRELRDWIPPSARRLDVLLHTLERVERGDDAWRARGGTHRAGVGRGPDAGNRDGERGRGAERGRGRGSGRGAGSEAAASGNEAIEVPIAQVAERLHRHGIVALVSDLYAEPEAVRDAVRGLRRGGSDVVVFHVLDPAELTLPFDSPLNLRDLETGRRIPVVPEEARERYRERIEAHTAALARLLGRDGVDYTLCDTSEPLDRALFDYLTNRERRSRVR